MRTCIRVVYHLEEERLVYRVGKVQAVDYHLNQEYEGVTKERQEEELRVVGQDSEDAEQANHSFDDCYQPSQR